MIEITQERVMKLTLRVKIIGVLHCTIINWKLIIVWNTIMSNFLII